MRNRPSLPEPSPPQRRPACRGLRHGTVRDAAAVVLATLTLALVAWVGVAGCVSTRGVSRGDASSLAAAGQRYAEAVDRFLATAGRVQVDATSQRLVADDRLRNLTLQQYRAAAREDRRRLAVLARLQRHTRLLASYFIHLDDVARGASAQRAATDVEEVTASLARLGDALRPELGADALAEESAGAVTRAGTVVLRRVDTVRLRRELEARSGLIARELTLQELLLEAVADDLRHDLEVVATQREREQIIAPLLAPEPLAQPRGWIERRRLLLSLTPVVDGPTADSALDDLAQASRAAAALTSAFQGMGHDEPPPLSLDRALNRALERLGSALDAVEALAGGEPRPTHLDTPLDTPPDTQGGSS